MYVEQPRLNRVCLQLDTLTTDEMYWVQHFAISQSFYLKSCGLKYGTFRMSWAEKSGWGWVNITHICGVFGNWAFGNVQAKAVDYLRDVSILVNTIGSAFLTVVCCYYAYLELSGT